MFLNFNSAATVKFILSLVRVLLFLNVLLSSFWFFLPECAATPSVLDLEAHCPRKASACRQLERCAAIRESAQAQAFSMEAAGTPHISASVDFSLPAVGTLKRYFKALEYKYRVKTAALGTLKRYSIISLTLYLEWYSAYSIVESGGPHWLNKGKNAITHKPKIQIKFRLHH
jgi:hypothetical protein